jgi:hypothetical protein
MRRTDYIVRCLFTELPDASAIGIALGQGRGDRAYR